MSVLLPCLCLVGLGLLFGLIHMAACKSASEDPDAQGASTNPGCGHSCATCGFGGCSFAARPDRPGDGDIE